MSLGVYMHNLQMQHGHTYFTYPHKSFYKTCIVYTVMYSVYQSVFTVAKLSTLYVANLNKEQINKIPKGTLYKTFSYYNIDFTKYICML